MLNLAITPNGLLVSTDIDGVDHINDSRSPHMGDAPNRTCDQIWADLMEERTANGGAVFVAGDSIGALSQAPCILESADFDDEGINPKGRIWYFSEYATRDELQELADGKLVLFEELVQ